MGMEEDRRCTVSSRRSDAVAVDERVCVRRVRPCGYSYLSAERLQCGGGLTLLLACATPHYVSQKKIYIYRFGPAGMGWEPSARQRGRGQYKLSSKISWYKKSAPVQCR